MITFEELSKANATIKTTDIKGKDYAEVPQRIKAFRMLFPEGTIATEMLSNEGGVCVFRASVYNGSTLLGTGTAYEREDSSYINKTSYIENCETSAVGRALGMAGIGIDVSVASYEEVANAMLNQNKGGAAPAGNDRKATEGQLAVLRKIYTGENLNKLLAFNRIATLEEMSMAKASELIEKNKNRN